MGEGVEVSVNEVVEAGAPDPDATSWVLSRHAVEDGGFSFFGLGKGETQYSLGAQVRTEATCPDAVYAAGLREWPVPLPECASDVDVPGRIAGSGAPGPWGIYAPMIVEVDVSAECHAAARVGAPWPQECP